MLVRSRKMRGIQWPNLFVLGMLLFVALCGDFSHSCWQKGLHTTRPADRRQTPRHCCGPLVAKHARGNAVFPTANADSGHCAACMFFMGNNALAHLIPYVALPSPTSDGNLCCPALVPSKFFLAALRVRAPPSFSI